MTNTIVFLSVFAAPVLIGWLLGRAHVDPNTPEGRQYYASKPTPTPQEEK